MIARLAAPLCSATAAAAAKEYDERYDNDPGAVIIKKMAKAIVIHICLPPGVCSSIFTAQYHIMQVEAGGLQN